MVRIKTKNGTFSFPTTTLLCLKLLNGMMVFGYAVESIDGGSAVKFDTVGYKANYAGAFTPTTERHNTTYLEEFISIVSEPRVITESPGNYRFSYNGKNYYGY